MIPYSITEVKMVIDKHAMDIYHRELMKWLVKRVEELESQIGNKRK